MSLKGISRYSKTLTLTICLDDGLLSIALSEWNVVDVACNTGYVTEFQ